MENKNLDKKEKIDFVVIWVDGNDKEWQKQRNIHAGKDPEDTANHRFRDWDLLKYWFRGVEKFAPWVNNVYFVTCGHYPNWLNLNNPKLKFVKHEDYIPKEYLPTFSANPIEVNLHRLPGLSEKFVYFNDDMFLINNMVEEDFFRNGKPRYIAGMDVNDSKNGNFSYILLNDMQVILKDIEKNKINNIKLNFSKWFNFNYKFKTNLKTLLLMPFNNYSVLNNWHMPSPMLKKTMEDMWKDNYEVLHNTSNKKFRSKEDVNQYLFSWNHVLKGDFEPAKEKNGKYYMIKKDNTELLKTIKMQKSKMICINDSDENMDFEKTQKELMEAFESILPEKSQFEI